MTSKPKVIPVKEYGVLDLPINDLLGEHGRLELNPEIEKGDYFSVSLRRGVITLRTGGHVGYIPLNDQIVVHVEPRVPVVNLNLMAEVTRMPRTTLSWIREYRLNNTWSESYADLYATALAAHVESIMINGLLRDYLREEQNSSFPRGRILIGPTVQRFVTRDQNHRVVNAFFLRTVDNPANRCVKYAMWMMGSHYSKTSMRSRESRLIQQRLNSLYVALDGVTLDHTRRFMEDPIVTGEKSLPTHRAHYREALDISSAIVRQRGILLEGVKSGNVRLPSLLLNMSALFESYVRAILQVYAVEKNWTWQVLDGNAEGSRPLYKGKTTADATPDIVVQDMQSDSALVIEVKYIPVTGKPLREAVNQAVTYAACYESDRVVLVHPCGTGQTSGMEDLGDVGQIRVFQYRYNLSSIDLETEANLFGKSVGELLQLPP